MATSFPTSLDVLTNPTSSDALNSPDHAAQHANANDAIEAIEAAIGTTAAPVLAKLASPTFTGTPTLPTGTIAVKQTAGDNSTAVATTSFVTTADNLKANLASPTFTGTPAAPTASIGTNTTQLATTAFVAVQLSPIGMITAYAGSTAPTNWQLCYGQAISRTTYSSLFAVLGTTYGAGDGSTTFNLPDLRGRTVAGVDNMGGTDAGRLSTANTLGTTTGTETVTLTSAQSGVPAHAHANTVTNNAVTTGNQSADHSHTFGTGYVSSDHTHNTGFSFVGYASGGNLVAGVNGSVFNLATSGISANHTHSGSTAGMSVSHTHSVTSNVSISNVNNTAADAASAHSVMQPTMTINYIILAGA